MLIILQNVVLQQLCLCSQLFCNVFKFVYKKLFHTSILSIPEVLDSKPNCIIGKKFSKSEIQYSMWLSCCRIGQFLSWLEDCAVYACTDTPQLHSDPGIIRPSRLHVQCVASTLWSSAENNSFDVKSLLTDTLFQ